MTAGTMKRKMFFFWARRSNTMRLYLHRTLVQFILYSP